MPRRIPQTGRQPSNPHTDSGQPVAARGTAERLSSFHFIPGVAPDALAGPWLGTTSGMASGATPGIKCSRMSPFAPSFGFPPVSQGTALTVAAPGVLANESDPDDNSLSAFLGKG